MRRMLLTVFVTVMVAACGGGGDSSGDPGNADSENDVSGDTAGSGDSGGDSSLQDTGADDGSEVSENAMATVVFQGETYTFERNEWTECDLSDEGDPVPLGPNGYFGDGGRIEAPTAEHDYLEFGRGGERFFWSGRVGGEAFQYNYHPEGQSNEGETLELTDDHFRYSVQVGSEPGNINDASIEVTC